MADLRDPPLADDTPTPSALRPAAAPDRGWRQRAGTVSLPEVHGSIPPVAMSTHGHRFLHDLLRGSTADRVRHRVSIPVLMVRAK